MSGPQPLVGVRVVVTRGVSQASKLSAALVREGATAVEFATIKIEPAVDGGAALRDCIATTTYDWVVLTSANAVSGYMAARPGVEAAGARVGSGQRCAAVGARTRAAAEAAGLEVGLVPSTFTAEALVGEFDEGEGRVLYPCGSLAGSTIAHGLAMKGWTVDQVEAYQTLPATPAPSAFAEVSEADVVTFASASSVERFCQLVDPTGIPDIVVCIGPATSAAAAEVGLHVDRMANPHTIEGLVDAVVAEWNDRTVS